MTTFNLFQDNARLIEHLKKGDEAAYTYLVNTYNKTLFVYALSLINDSNGAKDVVQNVFLKVWEYRKRLNTNYSIKSFLYKTTYNEFVNQYHKSKAMSALESTYAEALHEVIDNDAEVLEKKIIFIRDGIAKLPHKCKEIFLLSKKEGLTNIEIAGYINVSIKTVEGHLTKAYNLLRERAGNKLKAYNN